jgi:hypothetical protein
MHSNSQRILKVRPIYRNIEIFIRWVYEMRLSRISDKSLLSTSYAMVTLMEFTEEVKEKAIQKILERNPELKSKWKIVIEEDFVYTVSPFSYIATTVRHRPNTVSFAEKMMKIRQLMSSIILCLLQESDYQLFSFESFFFTPSD